MSPSWKNTGGAGSRRWKVSGTIAVTVLALVGGGLGMALADTGTAAPKVLCPDVTVALPAVPASAKAEVDRNLALLQTQINEANTRLANSVGEGGANFIQNAILGPLEDKRIATINRIATAIGRTATKPTGLDSLAACSLRNAEGGAVEAPAAAPAVGAPADGAADGGATGAIVCPTVADQLPAIPAQAQAEVDRNLALLETQIDEANARLVSSVGQGGANFVQNAILGPLEDKRIAVINRIATAIGRNAARPAGLEVLAACALGEADGAEGGAGDGAADPAAPPAEQPPAAGAPAGEDADGGDLAGLILCPTVADQLPAIPAQAQAEVDRNLALLETQIDEANARLASSVGQGGANFVQNAILGPLADKRTAVINRIATAIGRNAARPAGLETLAPCSLNT